MAYTHGFSQNDVSYLLDECKALEEDLTRTGRINRIMEEYAVYIQEAYFDTGRTVDETYYGEYEVERISKRRILVLRRYDPDGACVVVAEWIIRRLIYKTQTNLIRPAHRSGRLRRISRNRSSKTSNVAIR